MPPKKKGKSIAALQKKITTIEAKKKKKCGRLPKDKNVSTIARQLLSKLLKKRAKKNQRSGNMEDAKALKPDAPRVPSPKYAISLINVSHVSDSMYI
jgi:hypothetical protein